MYLDLILLCNLCVLISIIARGQNIVNEMNLQIEYESEI